MYDAMKSERPTRYRPSECVRLRYHSNDHSKRMFEISTTVGKLLYTLPSCTALVTSLTPFQNLHLHAI